MALTGIFLFLCGCSLCWGVDILFQVIEQESNDVYLGNLGTQLKNKGRVTEEQLKDMTFNILNVDEIYVSKFTLAENSGDLFALANIDREALCESKPSCILPLRIGAKSGTIFITMNVNISVNDINDNQPDFGRKSIELPIQERSPINSTFPIPSANDADATGTNNSKVAYELNPDTGIFGLQLEVSQQGRTDVNIVLKQSVDREIQSSYQIYVVAKDFGRPQQTNTLSVNISVLDYNDNKPVFTENSYSVTVPEDVSVGKVVLTVNTTDKDIGNNGEVRYHFSDSSSTSSRSFFQINSQSGDISVAKTLAYPENGEPFTLFVRAEDMGIPQLQSEAVVKIYVIDINNHAPDIKINTLSSSNIASVKENSKKGSIVAYVAVVDKDSSVNGQVICSLSSALFGLEVIPDSGNKEFKVVTKMPLNREASIEHVVTIDCNDFGNPRQENSVSFIVQVQDENDNKPVFSEEVYYANITENNDLDSLVLRVMASDMDQGLNANIQFFIENDKVDQFYVDSSKGFIKTKVKFDREWQDQIFFTVMAVDGGTPRLTSTATVFLTILDQNDETPVFTTSHFKFEILENSPADCQVGNLTAYDKDIGKNGEIMFSLNKMYQLNSPFMIHPNGTITVTRVLDREQKSEYSFKVTAQDKGIPIKNTTTDVTIRVLDENDNYPVIRVPSQNNSTVAVSHLTPQGSEVSHVEANDPDEGVNGSLVFLLSKSDQNLFYIEESTGKIYLGRTITINDIKEYTLFIIVSDKGKQPKQRATRIRLKVEYSTVSNRVTGVIGKNVLIAISIACVTIVLSLVIIVTIFLIRRVDKKKFNDSTHKEIEANKIIHDASSGALFVTKMTNLHERPINNINNKKEVNFLVDEPGDSRIFTLANDHTSPVPACRNPHLQNNTSNLTHSMNWQFLFLKSNTEDSRSDCSGDGTVSDSGRGGSDEDMNNVHPSIMI